MDTYIKYRFYRNFLPDTGDKVAFEFTKLEDTLVRIKLLEYDDYPGMILLTELTRKKNIASLQKLCPINQITVGEVLSKEKKGDDTYVFVSIKNLSKEEQSSYMDYYHKSKKFINFMKRISYNENIPLLDICEKIAWPIYDNLECSELIHPIDLVDHPDKIKKAVIAIQVDKNESNDDGKKEKKKKENEDTVKDKNSLVKLEKFASLSENIFDTNSGDDLDAEDDSNINLIISPETSTLLLASHEQFFGKLINQKIIKIGLISYDINGSELIKQILSELRDICSKEFTSVTLIVNMRDIPIYEIKIKSINILELEKAQEYIIKYLNNGDNAVIRKVISPSLT